MVDNLFPARSKNKEFVVMHKSLLKQYAQKKQQILGSGIIVINLLLLETAKIEELNLLNFDPDQEEEANVHQPISYIPENSFWFKMISLKIKKKHNIDIQAEEGNGEKVFIVLIKDAAIEYFSIYTISQVDDLPS